MSDELINSEDREILREKVEAKATDLGEFALSDLTEALIREGVLGSIRHTSPAFMKFAIDGFRDWARSVLRRTKTNDGSAMAYSLEEGAKARWRTWATMTRRDARLHWQLLKKKAKEMRLEMRDFKKRCEERWPGIDLDAEE